MSENPLVCDFYGSSAGFDTSVNETEYLMFLILHLWRKQDDIIRKRLSILILPRPKTGYKSKTKTIKI